MAVMGDGSGDFFISDALWLKMWPMDERRKAYNDYRMTNNLVTVFLATKVLWI